MTAIHEPRTFPFAERMSRIAAADIIRRLTDVCDLPYPATVQFSEGVSGPLALFVDTDHDREQWLAAFVGQPPRIAGREVAVLSVQAARERLAANTCESCGGDMVHQFGCPAEAAAIPVVVLDLDPDAPIVHWVGASGRNMCPDPNIETLGTRDAARATCVDCRQAYIAEAVNRPIPYVPVPMPTGAQANAAECARLNGDEPFRWSDLPHSDHPDCTGDDACPMHPTVTPELTDRPQPAIHFVTHAGHQRRDLPESLHVIPDGVLPRRKTPAEVELHEVPIVEVVTVDPDLTAGNDAVIAPLLPPQTSYGEAAERLEIVRDADEFAGIVSEVQS